MAAGPNEVSLTWIRTKIRTLQSAGTMPLVPEVHTAQDSSRVGILFTVSESINGDLHTESNLVLAVQCSAVQSRCYQILILPFLSTYVNFAAGSNKRTGRQFVWIKYGWPLEAATVDEGVWAQDGASRTLCLTGADGYRVARQADDKIHAWMSLVTYMKWHWKK
jgi:hypothetical protein